MKRIATLFLALLTLAACQDRGPTAPQPELELTAAAVSGIVYQVTGSGAVVREDLEGAPRETYGFQAQVDAAGNAGGEAEVHFPSDEVKVHIDVQCLVVERNRAWLSGPVTRSDDPETPVGRVYVWMVVDGGEGGDAAPDRISSFVHRPGDNLPPDICQQQWRLDTYRWDHGGVRILTPGAPGLADFVGTWDATKFVCTNLAEPSESQSLITPDFRIRHTVSPSGQLTNMFWTPGPPAMLLENTSGWMDVVDGIAYVHSDEASFVIEYPADLTGIVLRAEFDAPVCHWDEDEVEDPSHVIWEMRRKLTGVLIEDVAGAWDATEWRNTSVADPGTSVDLVADEGLSITMTVLRNSKVYLSVEPGGWTGDRDWLLLEGDRILTRSADGDGASFVYSLKKDAWSFSGVNEHDFGGGNEPAVLEVALVR